MPFARWHVCPHTAGARAGQPLRMSAVHGCSAMWEACATAGASPPAGRRVRSDLHRTAPGSTSIHPFPPQLPGLCVQPLPNTATLATECGGRSPSTLAMLSVCPPSRARRRSGNFVPPEAPRRCPCTHFGAGTRWCRGRHAQARRGSRWWASSARSRPSSCVGSGAVRRGTIACRTAPLGAHWAALAASRSSRRHAPHNR